MHNHITKLVAKSYRVSSILIGKLCTMPSKRITSCNLQCLQKSHDNIPLPHGVPTVVGRTPATKITDARCSRNQVELTADWTLHCVKVKQLGGNASSIDGEEIGKNKEVTMGKNSTLFVLSGQYPHRVMFEYEQSNDEKSTSDSKVDKTKRKVKDGDIQKDHTTNSLSEKKKRKHEEDKPSSKDRPKHKTEVSSKDKVPTKRQSTETHDYENRKKQKTGESEFKYGKTANGTKGDIQDHPENESDDDEHIKTVADKLKELKKGAQEEQVVSRKEDDISSLATSSKPHPKTPNPDLSSSNKKMFFQTAATENGSWETHEHLYVYTSKGVKPRSKIAGFDIDGTIIVPKSGKAFPVDRDDWKILMPETFGKLKKLNADKFKIAFFTNQLGVARGKTKIEDLKVKIEHVVSKLQVPIQVFIATHEGKYRKPMDGMWKKLKQKYNGEVDIDLKGSVYVGDAAGRLANWAPKKKKDFSCSDRLFAINIGVTFKTPEEFFQNQKPTTSFKMPEFDPRDLRSDAQLLSSGSRLTSDSKEIIVLVGFPGSGKSHFAANSLKPQGYEIVSRDKLGSWQKCVSKAEKILENTSVVVDNTNLSKEERGRYVKVAQEKKVLCRCFVFTTTIEHCKHNERFRQMTDKSHAKINTMLFNTIKSKFEEPSMSEGFTDIVNVNFVPKFSSSSEEAVYRKFLLEK